VAEEEGGHESPSPDLLGAAGGVAVGSQVKVAWHEHDYDDGR
jgi:hypothetical protein